MLNRYLYYVVFLLLVACNNQFHQSKAGVKKQIAVIRNYIHAEDSRDPALLKILLADTMTAYWKIENPTRQKVIDFYEDYWTKNKYSKNVVHSITPVAKNTYTVKTFFEVQRIHADTALHFESTIVYKLNAAYKIVFVGKE